MLGGGMAYAAVSYLPHEVPTATNARKGTPFWTVATRAGLEVRVLNVPVTFPAEEHDDLSMLSGLGVPDMRGRIGTPSYFTSDQSLVLTDNQFSVEIIKLSARRGTVETAVYGPRRDASGARRSRSVSKQTASHVVWTSHSRS
jgi:hypothetical protein